MAAKISTEVTDLRASCRYLLKALVRQGIQVATSLTQLVAPHRQDGDEEPGFLASIVALGRRLGASMDQLVVALAAALDEGMLLARHLDERSLKSLRTLISKCRRELDLDEELRRRVKKVEEVVNAKPEKAFHALDGLRRHFVVSVPGLL